MKIYIFLAIILASCSAKQTDLSKQAAQEIIAADKAMSDLASKDGFFKALLAYSADSVIIPREGKLPLFGKIEVTKVWSAKPVITTIAWKPIKAFASESGDMGYSFGYATFASEDSTRYTNYCTIWHKQKDGSWKFVYDAGNNIPNPNQ